MGLLTGALAFLLAVWFVGTLGAAIVTGALSAPVVGLLPQVADADPMQAGLGLFIAGTALMLCVAWILSAMTLAVRQRAA